MEDLVVVLVLLLLAHLAELEELEELAEVAVVGEDQPQVVLEVQVAKAVTVVSMSLLGDCKCGSCYI
jgi:hypothetical protein